MKLKKKKTEKGKFSRNKLKRKKSSKRNKIM